MQKLTFGLLFGFMIFATSVARAEDQIGDLASAARTGQASFDPFATAISRPTGAGMDPTQLLLLLQPNQNGAADSASDADLMSLLVMLTETQNSPNDVTTPAIARIRPPVIASWDPLATTVLSARQERRAARHHKRSILECTSALTECIHDDGDQTGCNANYQDCTHGITE